MDPHRLDRHCFYPHRIQKLTSEEEKGLSECLIKIAEWKKFKKDYEALNERLESLAHHISYDVMVPFGSLAFMPGCLIHTNDVTVYLGDDWFADMSTKQAADMVKRRIKQCDDMLEKLNLEKNQFESWLKYISEVAAGENLVEILEVYDEETEKPSLKARRTKFESDRRKTSEDKNAAVKGIMNTSNTDAKFKKTVDETLLKRFTTEDTKDKHCMASKENKPSSPESDPDDEDSSEDDSIDSDDDSSDTDEEGGKECIKSLKSEKKHVKWVDQVKPTANKITFTHSQVKGEHNLQGKSFSCPSSVILSPSDIYKSFKQAIEPKSILKKSDTINEPEQTVNCQNESGDHLLDAKISSPKLNQSCEKREYKEPTTEKQVAFSGEIVENVSEKRSEDKDNLKISHRPVSRFKSSRRNKPT